MRAYIIKKNFINFPFTFKFHFNHYKIFFTNFKIYKYDLNKLKNTNLEKKLFLLKIKTFYFKI